MITVKKSVINLCVLLLLVTISCQQQEIVLPQLPYTGKISIQGFVEADSIPVVYINRTVPYLYGSTNTSMLVLRNVKVSIASPSSSDVLQLESSYNKLDCRYDYFYKGSMPSLKNTTYTLTVDDGERIFSASATTSLTAVIIESVGYTSVFKDLYGEHEGVITYFKDILNQENFYRYEMFRAVDSTVRRGEKKLYGSCLAGDTVMYRELGRSVYSDSNIDGFPMNIIVEPALSHGPDTTRGYYVQGWVRIQSLDKSAYDFFHQIDEQKLGVYNPFVEPTYLRDGQFGKDAFGFFGSRVRSEPVRFVFPE